MTCSALREFAPEHARNRAVVRKYHIDMAEFEPVRYRSFAEFLSSGRARVSVDSRRSGRLRRGAIFRVEESRTRPEFGRGLRAAGQGQLDPRSDRWPVPPRPGSQFPIAAFAGAAPTRQTALPTSSATSKLPLRSIATPTGRPNASR